MKEKGITGMRKKPVHVTAEKDIRQKKMMKARIRMIFPG